MTDVSQEPEGATPLTPEQRADVKQSWITTRDDLNKAERDNIVKGAAWARRRRGRDPIDLPTPDFALELHRRMFGDVRRWAGTYRKIKTTPGIDPHRIQLDAPMMFDDVRYWIRENIYPPDEIAVRMHNKLTYIHIFPDGNGRHARMMADLLAERMGGKSFSWGSGPLSKVGSELRTKYIAAQKAADNNEIAPLLAFARS